MVLAFTSAADAALTSITRHRLSQLRNEPGMRARAVARMLDEPYRIKATIIVLNTIAAMLIGACAALLIWPIERLWEALGGLVLLLVVILVGSEAIPKALASRESSLAARLLAGPLIVCSYLVWPLTAAVEWAIRPIFKQLSGRNPTHGALVTEEELRHIVNVGEEEGLIEHEKREMIEGVMSFDDTLLREIMVPRVDIVALDINSTIDEALDTVISKGHSRIPVYEGSLDRVVGILYAKDLLPALRRSQASPELRALLRPAHFVPETIRVNALLADLQKRKVYLAVAVDEYGGVSGLATIEDLIEQIVGEIQDEYDSEDPPIQEVEPGVYLVEATVSIDELNDVTGFHLEAEDADRIGGLVAEALGRVPKVGDVIEVGDAVISVISMKGVRLQQLRVRPRPAVAVNSAVELRREREAHGSA